MVGQEGRGWGAGGHRAMISGVFQPHSPAMQLCPLPRAPILHRAVSKSLPAGTPRRPPGSADMKQRSHSPAPQAASRELSSTGLGGPQRAPGATAPQHPWRRQLRAELRAPLGATAGTGIRRPQQRLHRQNSILTCSLSPPPHLKPSPLVLPSKPCPSASCRPAAPMGTERPNPALPAALPLHPAAKGTRLTSACCPPAGCDPRLPSLRSLPQQPGSLSAHPGCGWLRCGCSRCSGSPALSWHRS